MWSAKRVCSGSLRCPQWVQMAEQSCSSRTNSPPHSGHAIVGHETKMVTWRDPRHPRLIIYVPTFHYKYPASTALSPSHPATIMSPVGVKLDFQSKSSTTARRRLSSTTGTKPVVKAYASLTVNIDHRAIVHSLIS